MYLISYIYRALFRAHYRYASRIRLLIWGPQKQSHKSMYRIFQGFVRFSSTVFTELVRFSNSADPQTVNIILVIGQEKLHAEMQRTYGRSIHVIRLQKSAGVRRFTFLLHSARVGS